MYVGTELVSKLSSSISSSSVNESEAGSIITMSRSLDQHATKSAASGKVGINFCSTMKRMKAYLTKNIIHFKEQSKKNMLFQLTFVPSVGTYLYTPLFTDIAFDYNKNIFPKKCKNT
jgi:hypothetical protein